MSRLTILQVGNAYTIDFTIKETQRVPAGNVSLTIAVDDTDNLAFSSITSVKGQVSPTNNNVWNFGTLSPLESTTASITFTLLQESQDLNFTATVSTTSIENNLSDNVVTCNLLEKLPGSYVFYSDLPEPVSVFYGAYDSVQEALDDTTLPVNSWFYLSLNNSEQMPSLGVYGPYFRKVII